MKTWKVVLLFAVVTSALSGCAATITPRGEVYTQVLVPPPVVVSRPVVVTSHRPHRRPPLHVRVPKNHPRAGHSHPGHSHSARPHGPR